MCVCARDQQWRRLHCDTVFVALYIYTYIDLYI